MLLDQAGKDGMVIHEVETSNFRHLVVEQSLSSSRQVVFIEGDGRPWSDSGQEPTDDPTPDHALAYELMVRTPAHAFYVSRPCYFQIADENCTSNIWTSDRYSREVIESIVAALSQVLESSKPITVVGYSGGAAIAHLVALELPLVDTVISVAGLFDTDRWTSHHGYEPLINSLNPATTRRRESTMYVYLHGEQDRNVPISHLDDISKDADNVILVSFESYGHVCCWVKNWEHTWRDEINVIPQTGRTSASQ
jgi:dienelactone hydrolase